MKVSLSQVLKSKNPREDSREKYLSYQHSMLFKSWLDSVQSIISSPRTDRKLRIDKSPNTTTIGIDYDPSIPNIKDQDRCLQDSNLPIAMRRMQMANFWLQ